MSSCTQEAGRQAANPVNFQNKTPVQIINFTKSPRVTYDVWTYACVHMSTVFFSPESVSKNKGGREG